MATQHITAWFAVPDNFAPIFSRDVEDICEAFKIKLSYTHVQMKDVDTIAKEDDRSAGTIFLMDMDGDPRGIDMILSSYAATGLPAGYAGVPGLGG